MFQKLYDKMIDWSRHPKAVKYLAGISFAESSFFPVPPDVMLAPMSMANPTRSNYYAFVTTISSVLGGILGYFLGRLMYEPIVIPVFTYLNMADKLPIVEAMFVEYGGIAILIAGFVTPIPYKLITITTGVFGVNFYLFILLSFIARGLRFFMVATAMRLGGQRMESWLRKNINILSITMILGFAVVYFAIR